MDNLEVTNLLPTLSFRKVHRRRVVRLLKFGKFLPNTTLWAYQTLIRFIEILVGKRAYICFHPYIQTSLSFLEITRCHLLGSRVSGFQRILGPRIFLTESVQIIYLALKYKDPTFLTN